MAVLGSATGDRMNRREVLLVLLALGIAPLASHAQQVPRIGFLSSSSAERDKRFLAVFLGRLRELGYLEGKSIFVEQRYADGTFQGLPGLVAELLDLKVNILVVSGAPAARAAKNATGVVPIVMTNAADPVGNGLVASLARPGGNVTGLSDFNASIVTKLLDLIKEVVPSASRFAVLSNPSNPANPPQVKELQAAAAASRLVVLSYEAASGAEIERAFAAMKSANPKGLIVLGDPLLGADPARIVALARKARLPAIFSGSRAVEAGGLLSYGANFDDLYRGAASYVDRILKGANPADLPVEQPSTLELAINPKAARELGLKFPKSILLRANRVIE
jgi:putative ABC transport system substrate-binding protein